MGIDPCWLPSDKWLSVSRQSTPYLSLMSILVTGGAGYIGSHFIHLRSLWQFGASAGHRGHAACTDLALWLVQANDGNHAARCRHGS